MGARTIPAPSADEVIVAKQALRTQAQLKKLDLMDPNVNDFIEHQAKVNAQMMAEIRWLRNLVHDPRNCKKQESTYEQEYRDWALEQNILHDHGYMNG